MARMKLTSHTFHCPHLVAFNVLVHVPSSVGSLSCLLSLAGSYDGSDPSSSSVPEALKKEFIRHKVDYLGVLPISARATNLAALQRPLKDLYFKYRALRNLGQSNLPGTLEISDTGLTVQYIREMHKGVQVSDSAASVGQ